MPLPAEKIKTLIQAAFPDAVVELKDLVGDNDHFSATITSSSFKGKTRLQQHQMVYHALEGYVGTRLHALSLTTKIP